MRERRTQHQTVPGRQADCYSEEPSSPGAARERREYRSPYLRCYGDIRTLTLGGSEGFGDSSPAPQNLLM